MFIRFEIYPSSSMAEGNDFLTPGSVDNLKIPNGPCQTVVDLTPAKLTALLTYIQANKEGVNTSAVDASMTALT
jgi:hypothetical protein